jgi:hypothetical protein
MLGYLHNIRCAVCMNTQFKGLRSNDSDLLDDISGFEEELLVREGGPVLDLALEVEAGRGVADPAQPLFVGERQAGMVVPLAGVLRPIQMFFFLLA